ncbi:molybdate ABC transporter substrate-binding protein [Ferrovibrio xuzhouensis]|uniref:Molybdate ABC transporter substrate-binding protein n=1 Tax=Ferrovibrio xuzhouensis TaxID=1576914 RepID=A0ABV7VGU2_9PROT
MRRPASSLAVFALAAALFVAAPAAHAADLLVFAAASLKNALAEVDAGWAGTARGKAAGVKTSFAGSSALARQIEAGAPADLFISADLDWMDYLQKEDLVKTATRGTLLGNAIVLVAPQDGGPASARIADLPALLGKDARLAMADTRAVPAGKYGKAALEHLKLWDGVSGRIAQAENVRAALALVARGEAPFGIVYATDAAAEPKVRVVARFPAGSHPPILYPAAVLAASTNPAAAAYLDYLHGPAAAAIFARNGFTVLPAAPKTN